MSVFPLPRWVAKTRKAILWAGLLVGLAIIFAPRLTSWFPFTFPFAHPEQDACEFGPVTNAEYRTMLSKARSIQRWTWLPLESAGRVLLNQFRVVSDSNPSPYVKIAAMHAVFRALGADFRNTYADEETIARVAKDGGTLSFSYALPVPRIGVISLPANAWLMGSINGPMRASVLYAPEAARYHKGAFDFIVHFPNPIDAIPDTLGRGPDSCPPVPPNELQASFEEN
jgi:hypothetical protein